MSRVPRTDFFGRRRVALTVAAIAVVTGACSAEEAEPARSAPAVVVEPAPVTQPAAADPNSAEAWLGRIEERTGRLKSFRADIRWDRAQGIEGDKVKRYGTIVYQPGPPSRFAAHFDKLVADGRGEKQDKWYVFDGQWLVERDGMAKHFNKRQVVAPDQVGKADPLSLGEGPFPLPIGAKKEQVLRRFDVTVSPPAEKDPPKSVHLLLKPKAGRRTDLVRIDLWYDRDTLLPVRVRTQDDSENTSLIEIDPEKVKLDDPVDAKAFDVAEPGAGWTVEVAPWEEEK